jgi:hypothetical protein
MNARFIPPIGPAPAVGKLPVPGGGNKLAKGFGAGCWISGRLDPVLVAVFVVLAVDRTPGAGKPPPIPSPQTEIG